MTSDLLARIAQHRAGTFDGFTARYGVYRLVWFDCAPTVADPIAHEKPVKKWPRAYKLTLVERDNPTWRDLAIDLGLPPID